jgi:RNA polymerase subunit RPABC4/transcription elongation factor Spt4
MTDEPEPLEPEEAEKMFQEEENGEREDIPAGEPVNGELIYCSYCGNKLSNGVDNCPNCGVSINQETNDNLVHKTEESINEVQECSECGNNFQSSYSTCPHCDTSQSEKNYAGQILIAFVTGAMLLFGLLVTFANLSFDDGPDKLGAYTMAQQFIKERLKSPSTAEFPSEHSDELTTHLGDGKFIVDSYLDAQNSFGAIVRVEYRVKLEHINEDTWRLLDIDMEHR